ncbi:MAG: S8 family serine peptidase [Lachnospiraceae bacterium]|nr:S8 family serine peptidase [Lachnospiraceae bacterium]
MKRKAYGMAVLLLAIILVGAISLELLGLAPWEALTGGDSLPVPEEYADQITVYENGDFVYTYTEDHIALDTDEWVIYVDELVDVFLTEELSGAEKQELAAQVNGTIVTDISGIVNMMQILVDVTDYAGICEYADILNENEIVRSASFDVPFYNEDMSVYSDNNPWSDTGEEEDRGNEENPNGNDWWAEAIGAYTAWSYEDYFTSDVVAGVLDGVVNTEHEDLSSCIQLINYTPGKYSDHGTMVAGIIGATDNNVGIRGIASSTNYNLTIYAIDQTGNSDTSISVDDKYNLYSYTVNSGSFFESIKTFLEKDVKVINMSFGYSHPFTESKYKELVKSQDSSIKKFIDKNVAYNTYLEIVENAADSISELCIDLMIDLLDMGQDFLIVEAAGNGWNNGGEGHDSTYCTGYFTGIRKDLFSDENMDYYNAVNEHILIVGCVENYTDDDGNYRMYTYSNFGENVDICAPGYNIYHLSGDGYITDLGGTSAAAPMVTGAAALLWSIEPSLTASEVRGYLLSEHNSIHAVSVYSEDMYPMLNVGAAVEALLEDIENLGTCSGNVYDSLTEEPVEGAVVTITNVREYNTFERIWNYIKNAFDHDSLETREIEISTTTDEYGWYLLDENISAGEYELTVEADGYYTYSETTTVKPNGALDSTVYYVDTIYLVPLSESSSIPVIRERETEAEAEPSAAEADETASMYAAYLEVIESYESQYGAGSYYIWDQTDYYTYYKVSGVYLIELLDFDGDGQEELMLCVLDPDSSAPVYGASVFADVWAYKDGEAVLVYSPELQADESYDMLHDGGVWYEEGVCMNIIAASEIQIYFAYTSYNGKIYMMQGLWGGVTNEYYYGYEDGEFHLVHTSVEDEDTRTCYVDGEAVSDSEWQEQRELWNAGMVQYHLLSVDDTSELQGMLSIAEETKSFIRANAGDEEETELMVVIQ